MRLCGPCGRLADRPARTLRLEAQSFAKSAQSSRAVVAPPGIITRDRLTSYDGAGSRSCGRDPGGTMTMRGPWGARRPSGWPVLRTPKWMLAAAVVLVAGLTLAAIS